MLHTLETLGLRLFLTHGVDVFADREQAAVVPKPAMSTAKLCAAPNLLRMAASGANS